MVHRDLRYDNLAEENIKLAVIGGCPFSERGSPGSEVAGARGLGLGGHML